MKNKIEMDINELLEGQLPHKYKNYSNSELLNEYKTPGEHSKEMMMEIAKRVHQRYVDLDGNILKSEGEVWQTQLGSNTILYNSDGIKIEAYNALKDVYIHKTLAEAKAELEEEGRIISVIIEFTPLSNFYAVTKVQSDAFKLSKQYKENTDSFKIHE